MPKLLSSSSSSSSSSASSTVCRRDSPWSDHPASDQLSGRAATSISNNKFSILARFSLLLVFALMVQVESLCPQGCSCSQVKSKIDCSGRGLDNFPEGIDEQVISLDLSNNSISQVQDSLNHLENLKYLNLSHNQLEDFSPNLISKLEKLETLDLSNNPSLNVTPEAYKKIKNLKIDVITSDEPTASKLINFPWTASSFYIPKSHSLEELIAFIDDFEKKNMGDPHASEKLNKQLAKDHITYIPFKGTEAMKKSIADRRFADLIKQLRETKVFPSDNEYGTNQESKLFNPYNNYKADAEKFDEILKKFKDVEVVYKGPGLFPPVQVSSFNIPRVGNFPNDNNNNHNNYNDNNYYADIHIADLDPIEEKRKAKKKLKILCWIIIIVAAIFIAILKEIIKKRRKDRERSQRLAQRSEIAQRLGRTLERTGVNHLTPNAPSSCLLFSYTLEVPPNQQNQMSDQSIPTPPPTYEEAINMPRTAGFLQQQPPNYMTQNEPVNEAVKITVNE